MEQDVIKDGEERQKGYREVSKMCQSRSVEVSNEIKAAQAEVDDYKATIDKAKDDTDETTTLIEELSATLSNAEADLKAATAIRKKEAEDFGVDQKDMVSTISEMERAISILEKQLKGATSLAQLPMSVQKGAIQVQQQRSAALAEAFAAMIDSSSLDSADTARLTALIETSEGDSDSESAADTEADAADLDAAEESYTGNSNSKGSGSIVETLENLLEKAQAQLEGARQKETKSRFNYELFSESLKRKLEVAQNEMNEAKKALGEFGANKATAEGNLEVTTKDLAEDHKALNELHHECMTKASDFEAETTSRNEELKALATAKKAIKEMTGAAEEKTYGDFAQVSFVQAKARSSPVSASAQAVRSVRALGKQQNMPVLIDLAHDMESVVRNSALSGADPFSKVKTMLSGMLSKLVKQMEAEFNRKKYCDKELGDTQKSKFVKEGTVEKLQTKVDTQSSTSMNLREQVGRLQKELLAIMQTQQNIDIIRKKENALYKKTKPELKAGQQGIKKALQVLREYYSQDEEQPADDKKGGAGANIIGLLEVVESDFAKGLAILDEEEDTAQGQYVKQTNENELTIAVKKQEVTFKTKTIKSLSKSTSELSSDLDGVQSELDAVNEYYTKIQEECVAKADPYEERRKRQETTLKGLRDANEILEGRAAFVQQDSKRLRGSSASNSEDQ